METLSYRITMLSEQSTAVRSTSFDVTDALKTRFSSLTSYSKVMTVPSSFFISSGSPLEGYVMTAIAAKMIRNLFINFIIITFSIK